MPAIKDIRRKNLDLLIKHHGTQKALADAASMDAGHISQLCTGHRGIGEELARKMERALGLSSGWMDRPHTERLVQKFDRVGEQGQNYANLADGPDLGYSVPLIDWPSAKEWQDMLDSWEFHDVVRWLPRPASRGGLRTVALRVRGDSMVNLYGKSYPDGCIIYVDTDKLSPHSGERIIASVEEQPDLVFKQYVNDAGTEFLKSLNPAYPPIIKPFTVLGTVVGKWEDE